ncbi:MAG: hypothetical protein HQL64_03970 [Magnetococcales bacterium]|nr:hypothetical protein [Magnetococcales bacterium]
MVNRIVLLVLSILGAAALPYSFNLAFGSYNEYMQAQGNLKAAREHRAIVDARRNQVKAYKAYSQEIDGFVSEVKGRSALESDWIQFKIDNVTRALEANDFRLVIANVMHGGDYYFNPSRLEIVTSSSEEFSTLIKDKKTGSAKADGKKPGAGSQVVMTIKGEYLVARKRD